MAVRPVPIRRDQDYGGTRRILDLPAASANGHPFTYQQAGALAYKATVDATSLIADGVVTEAKLDSAAQEKLNRSQKNNFTATANPAVTNDDSQGYAAGSVWINTASSPKESFRCVDASTGAAVWVNTSLTADELAALAFKATIDSSSLLADSVVSYAKIQNVSATDKILGRSTAGAGVVEEIDCTSHGRALISGANAAATRSTLGLVIGTNVQAQNAKLQAVADMDVTDGNIIVANGTGLVAESGLTARASLGLTIGSDVQAHADGLDDIAGITHADGGFVVSDGTNWVIETLGTARASLGLGSAAVAALIDDDSMATATSSNIASAESVKAYVDAQVQEATPLPFTSSDFVLAGGVQTLTITQATHGFTAGAFAILGIDEDDGTYFLPQEGLDVAEVKANGNIELNVYDGEEFNGRINVIALA